MRRKFQEETEGRIADRFDGALASFRAGDLDGLLGLLEDTKQAANSNRALLASLRSEAQQAEAQAAGGVFEGYRIVRKIGQGGMGSIYEALEAPSRRRVALKLIRTQLACDDVEKRVWQREVQALARLEHPEIATLFHAGISAEGIPFIVMEYIDGEALDTWVHKHKLGCRDILEIFASLARVVEFAHTHGVIHLDLKPSNILVDSSGQLKVLDFGMARLLERQESSDDARQAETAWTMERSLAGTLPYLAPEQVEDLGTIDTRTDVYALGVILYELLCGQRPFEVHSDRPLEAIHKILNEQAPPASKLRAGLPRALDAIVAQTLVKDRQQRYASAAALADDVQRFLGGFPVMAQAPGSWATLWSFVRRKRRTAAVLAIGALTLITAFVVTLRARIEAQQQANRAQSSARALANIFSLARPGANAESKAGMRALIDRTVKRLSSDPPQEAWVEASVRTALGLLYVNWGLAQKGCPQLQRALDLRRSLHSSDHVDLAKSLRNLGFARHACGQLALAEPLLREALAMRLRLFTGSAGPVLQSRDELAELLIARGKPTAARALAQDQLEAVKTAPAKDPITQLRRLRDAANTLLDTRQTPQGLEVLQATWEQCLALPQADEELRLSLLRQLARAYTNHELPQLALAVYHDYLHTRDKTWMRGDPAHLRVQVDYAHLLLRSGAIDEAEQRLRQVLSLGAERLEASSPEFLEWRRQLAWTLSHQGRQKEAIALLEEIIQAQRSSLGESHPGLMRSFIALAQAQFASNNRAAAVTVLDRARAVLAARPELDKRSLAIYQAQRAQAAEGLQPAKEARWLRLAVANLRAAGDKDSELANAYQQRLAQCIASLKSNKH